MRSVIFLLVILLSACAQQTPDACEPVKHAGYNFTVCTYSAYEDIRLFLNHPDGAPFAQFDRLAEHMNSRGKTLVFAMNAGMYHEDRRPVGLYVQDGEPVAPIVMRAGPGNFGMLPNGVFYLTETGGAGVLETGAYADADLPSHSATQSGPMLVIDGALHPRFNADGTSRKRRNGVGISADGSQVHFAISDSFVTFHEFATLFRDHLRTPNALYLDGTVSRVYARDLGRNEDGLDMGPIVGVVR